MEILKDYLRHGFVFEVQALRMQSFISLIAWLQGRITLDGIPVRPLSLIEALSCVLSFAKSWCG